jgi:hypothetical protein
LFDAYHAVGAPATLELLADLGVDGDALFSHPTPTAWQEPVSHPIRGQRPLAFEAIDAHNRAANRKPRGGVTC